MKTIENPYIVLESPHVDTGTAIGHIATKEATKSQESATFPAIALYDQWQENQDRLDDNSSNLPYSQKMNLIKQNNEIQSKFIGFYGSKKTAKERDLITKAIFATLPKDKQESFANSGFIDGIVAELYTFEQLSKIPGITARMSNPEEDINDGYDIVLTTPKGKQIFVDAKSKVPRSDVIKSKKFPHNIAINPRRTRDGSDVIIICPNPKNIDGLRFIKKTKDGFNGNEVASFSKTLDNREGISLAELFIYCHNKEGLIR